MDFLAENNLCGQTLLRLVARGNAIIAELMRLKSFIPNVFKLETKLEQQKYSDIILDFAYFKSPLGHDKRIENTKVLHDLDEEIRESHSKIIERIYSAFESIHRYVSELILFLQELSEGTFIQRTLENVFLDEDGRQLMCEALHLYGTMLLVVDNLFPGSVRERIIVAHHRYIGQKASRDTTIDDVCKLLRSTGLSSLPGTRRPQNYPEEYFKRVEIPSNYIAMVVGHLRSDDIYHQVQAYPSPDHRSIALSTQAGMLFVCLYFTPSILQTQSAKMREIVDKYFPDNWVISYYMGITVNLIEAWEPYKAAKQALSNTLETTNIREQAAKIGSKLSHLSKQCHQLIAEGSLCEAKILDHNNKLLNLLRECNVTLHWALLHAASLDKTSASNVKRCRVIREQVLLDMKFDKAAFFDMLLNVAALEFKIMQINKKLVEEKTIRWEKFQKDASDQVLELSEVFDGNRPLARVTKNQKLFKWFKDISKEILSLKLDEPLSSGRKIIQLIQALKEVKDFHELESSAGVVQAVGDVVGGLQAMVKVSGITDSNLVTLALIYDFSYAWVLIEEYTPIMQNAIKNDPFHVAKLRAVFLKLASGLELPLLRINQAHSPDLVSVSAYYSGELVSYIRKVLQIIPETMFTLLAKLIRLQTSMKEIPTRLDKDKIRDYAQLDQRYEMAELSHGVAVLAEGISMMETTLVGVVELDPTQLLEDGVRRELVQQIAHILHNSITFNTRNKTSELNKKLEIIGQTISGFRTSFVYIQDYINMFGLKIWQEEMSRIVNYNVEQECNQLMKKKISDHESIYQNNAIPIPKFQSLDPNSVNFIGRLVREVIRVTDPRCTVYISQLGTWYDSRSHIEVMNSEIMKKIESSISTAALAGLDKLLAFLIVTELQKLVKDITDVTTKDPNIKDLINSLMTTLSKNQNSISQPQRQYYSWYQKCNKLTPIIVDYLISIGQMQILRIHAANQLNSSCKFQSKCLASALETMNISLMNDVKKHYADPTKPYPDPEGIVTSELSVFLEWCGMTQPMDRIYIVPKSLPSLSIVLMLTVVSQISKIYYAKHLGGNITGIKGTEGIDGGPFIVGIATLLRQFHSDHTEHFMQLIGQYISSITTTAASSGKIADLPHEVVTGLAILQDISLKMNIPYETLTNFIPVALLSSHR